MSKENIFLVVCISISWVLVYLYLQGSVIPLISSLIGGYIGVKLAEDK